jgi:hypothetical protein
VVEFLPSKQAVAGSSPVSRSKLIVNMRRFTVSGPAKPRDMNKAEIILEAGRFLKPGTYIHSAIGNLTEKRLPFPFWLCTSTSPPCASTRLLAIASPRPAPPVVLVLDLSTL